jgi:hypothetical protein
MQPQVLMIWYGIFSIFIILIVKKGNDTSII